MRPHIFRTGIADGKVGGNTATDSSWVTLPAIAKTSERVDNCVTNEYIAGHLARFIGLPVAPGAIIEMSRIPKVYAYAALRFNTTGETLPDVDPELLVEKLPRLATGLVIFDILIANPDRHTGNVSALLYGPRSERNEMLVFDHSHALLGYDANQSLNRLNALQNRLGITGGSATAQNRHCLLDFLKDESHFADWIYRVNCIPTYFINDLCSEMQNMNLLPDLHAVRLKDFLRFRTKNIGKIIRTYQSEFTGINEWGLTLW